MANFLKRTLEMIGLADEEEEILSDYSDDKVEKKEVEIPFIGGKRGKVVNIHTTTQLKVVVVTPDNFEYAKDIADHLKSKKPIVINLEGVEREVAKRIIDFLSGAVYALDGNIQKVSSGIFLIAPYNVGIMGDFKDELRSKVVFPFGR